MSRRRERTAKAAVSMLVAGLLSAVGMPRSAEAEIRIVSPAGAVLATPIRDNARLLGWTDDGAGLLVARHGRAFRVPAAGGRAVPVPALDRASQVGPGGRSAISRRYPAGVTLRAADGHVIARIAPADPRSEAVSEIVAWSPDGRRAAIVVDERVLVLDADTGSAVAAIRVPGIDVFTSLSTQAFAPDGSALVVLVDRQVVQIDVASGTSRLLDTLPEDRWHAPAWSVTGAISVTGRHRIRLVGAPSSDIRIGDWVHAGQWSPDGGSLTYSEWLSSSPCADGQAALTTVAPGSAARHLLALNGWIDAWAWSSDGKRVAVRFRRRVERRGKRRPWPHGIPRKYEMLTRSGDAAVRTLIVRVTVGLRHGAGRARSMEHLRTGLDRIGHRHPEVDDSAVQEAVAVVLDRWLRAAGFKSIDALEELDC